MSKDFIILKLGGSLITDKRKVEFVRKENLEMLSQQIAQALDEDESLKGENAKSLKHKNTKKH
jgi:isopentenyl phosphate kinase